MGPLAILRAIAQAGMGLSSARLQLETGYKATSRKTYIAQLRSRGLITSNGDRHCLTDAGEQATADVPTRQPGELRQALPDGERNILDAIASAGGRCGDSYIAVTTGYKPTSRKTYLRNLVLRELVLVDGGERRLTPLGEEETKGVRGPTLEGDELLEHYKRTLPEGESFVLDAIAFNPPCTPHEVGVATGYQPTSVKTYVARLVARKLVVRADGQLDLAPELKS